jgi:hypothetical protein
MVLVLVVLAGACNKRVDTSTDVPSSASRSQESSAANDLARASQNEASSSSQYAGERPEELGPHEIPRSWDFAEFEEQPPQTPGKVHVLAWAIEDRGGGFRVESCITIRVLDKNDGYGRWHAEHLYRHPGGKEPDWRISMMHALDDDFVGSWYMHYKRFTERPGNKAMYAAMDSYKELHWSFKADFGFVSCGVCEKAWEEVMGEKPTRFFKR